MSAQSACFMAWGNDQRPLTELVRELEESSMGKAFYEEYDLKDSKRFELLKGAPLCYKVNGLFIEESWLYNHMINFFNKVKYDIYNFY